MTDDRTTTRLWHKYCDDQVQLNIRLGALTRDWKRLRDIEQEWKLFSRRVGLAFFALVLLGLLSVLVGCTRDRPPEREPDLYLRDGTPCWLSSSPHGNTLRCDPTNKDKEKR